MVTGCVSLTSSLRALELVSGDAAQLHQAAGAPDRAVALLAITDHMVEVALEMAVALRAAVDGDLNPARRAIAALELKQILTTTSPEKVSHAAPTLPALDEAAPGAVGCADDSHSSEAA